MTMRGQTGQCRRPGERMDASPGGPMGVPLLMGSIPIPRFMEVME